MIYTITFNPSIDYVVKVPNISYEDVNRVTEEYFFTGGKGLNVSCVLKNLGIDSIALGYTAGFTGHQITLMVKEMGLHTDFIHIDNGMSRINVKIKSQQNSIPTESEINGMGPHIDASDLKALYSKLDTVTEDDYVVLAGSVQAGISPDIYKDLTILIQKKGAKCIVDASGALLANSLCARPFLIKPNKIEMEHILNRQLITQADIIHGAKELRNMGARNILVSLAEQGAILITEDNHIYYSNAPKGDVLNSVGAGDSMVAGFLAEYLNSGSFSNALKLGICAGSASAFSNGLATKEFILTLTDSVCIKELN